MSVLTEAPPLGEPWLCVRCTAVRGAHYLTCPTLSMPAGYSAAADDWGPVNGGAAPG